MGKVVGLVFQNQVQEKEREKLSCPVCGKEYVREADLLKHMEKEHPEHNSDSK